MSRALKTCVLLLGLQQPRMTLVKEKPSDLSPLEDDRLKTLSVVFAYFQSIEWKMQKEIQVVATSVLLLCWSFLLNFIVF